MAETDTSEALIEKVERASLAAWPGLTVEPYDGWVLRFADGYTKRANSVNVLSRGNLPLEHKIEHCEQAFRARGMPPIFRISPLGDARELDAFLDGLEYQKIDDTQVQYLDLSSRPVGDVQNACREVTLKDWIELFHMCQPISESRRSTHTTILSAIEGQLLPYTVAEDQNVASCGLGVLAGDLVGLFDMVTHEVFRRRGYGRTVAAAILNRARAKCATGAYLQVLDSNKPAVRLYEELGFDTLYRYWYRVPANWGD